LSSHSGAFSDRIRIFIYKCIKKKIIRLKRRIIATGNPKNQPDITFLLEENPRNNKQKTQRGA
jgi:hypothetical protein